MSKIVYKSVLVNELEMIDQLVSISVKNKRVQNLPHAIDENMRLAQQSDLEFTFKFI